MGLLHNGEVPDAGFWIAAERWLLNTSVRQWCSSMYWRRSEMTSSRSQANFLVSNTLSVGSALVQHSRVTSSRQRTFLAVDVMVVNGCFVTKPRKRIVAPLLSENSAHPRHVHISWPCSVAKNFGTICLHGKEQRAAGNDFLARLHRFFTCPTTTIFG